MIDREVPVGALVLFSSGCYSDYGVSLLAKVLKPISESVWIAMRDGGMMVPHWDEGGEKRWDETAGRQWLITNGYIEEMEYTELHMGEYGRCSEWSHA